MREKQFARQAEGYLELGMSQQALDSLSRLGDGTNLKSSTLLLRGEALRCLLRHEEALVPLNRAAKMAPDNVHVWLAMGWCYKRVDQLDLAIEALQRAAKVAPTDALIHYNLACYFSLAGAKQRALAHLSQAFAFDSAYRGLVDAEPDFDPIRDDPDFQAMTRLVA